MSSANETLLVGQPSLVQHLCSLSFKVSPATFMQTNPSQAEILYGMALSAAGNLQSDEPPPLHYVMLSQQMHSECLHWSLFFFLPFFSKAPSSKSWLGMVRLQSLLLTCLSPARPDQLLCSTG